MKISHLAIVLLLTGWAYAQDQPVPEFEWPATFAVVRANGEEVPVFWREGRPFVERSKTTHLFHVRTGPPDIDLGTVMREQGWTLKMNSDGSIDAEKTLAGSTRKTHVRSYTPSPAIRGSGPPVEFRPGPEPTSAPSA